MSKQFRFSYPDYYQLVESSIYEGIKICEIGPSGSPSIKSSIIQENNLNYTIIDIETVYWDKYNPNVKKYNIDLQYHFDISLESKFDLVISQMVLEHIEHPKQFHEGIFRLLKEGGHAIHLYANPFSLSAIVNRILPESTGAYILKVLKNRNLNRNHKYPAFYRWCFTPSISANTSFESIGFHIDKHIGYLGHNYFQYIPGLNHLEKIYNYLLFQFRMKNISTLSLLKLSK